MKHATKKNRSMQNFSVSDGLDHKIVPGRIKTFSFRDKDDQNGS